MRLLDVHQLTLKQFFDENNRPDYAILSHTWGDGEVSFQDLPTSAAKSLPGYAKIKKCCEQAIRDGFQYVWIDTCCIDKTSSSELSEAINSMYQWYKDARVCYVYLSDVASVEDPSVRKTRDASNDKGSDAPCDEDHDSEFSKSRWFTRGWTLQELLAPKFILFYNRDWVEIGTKYSLREVISEITGIPCEVLQSKPLSEICIAQRMSWAAMRETTRVEDIAYCLMGIFNVNMPTLYGEGWKAFIRLQHEIMKESNDHSLFAWRTQRSEYSDEWRHRKEADRDFLNRVLKQEPKGSESGLLASSPRDFQYSRRVRRCEGSDFPYSMTNNGLHIKLQLAYAAMGSGIYQAILDCTLVDGAGPLGIFLMQKSSRRYCRILTSIVRTVDDMDRAEAVTDLYVEPIYQLPSARLLRGDWEQYRFHLSSDASLEHGYKVLAVRRPGDSPEYRGDNTVFLVRLISDTTAQFFINVGPNSPSRFGNSHTGFSCAIHPCSYDDTLNHESKRLPKFESVRVRGTQLNVDRVTKQLPTGHIISVAIHPSPCTFKTVSNSKSVSSSQGKPFQLETQHFRLSVTASGSSQPISNQIIVKQAPPTLTIHVDPELEIPRTAWQPRQSWASSLRSSNIMLWTPTAGNSATVNLRSNLLCEELKNHPDKGLNGPLHDPVMELHASAKKLSVSFYMRGRVISKPDKLECFIVNHDRVNPGLDGGEHDGEIIKFDNGQELQLQLRQPVLLEEVGHQMWITVVRPEDIERSD